MQETLRAAILCAGLYFTFLVASRMQLYLRRRSFKKARGCEPAASSYPITEPFGINFLRQMIPAARRQELLPFFDSLHRKYGKTFVYQPWIGRGMVFTIDPENVKSVMATNFEGWVSREARQEGIGQLLGDGIFTTDGAFWAHSRALIRPQFDKSQVSEQVEPFEAATLKLIRRIPADGQTVDLQELFHKFTMDTSTEFLTGTSTNALDDEQADDAQRFIDAFDYAMTDATWRIRLGKLYFLRPDKEAPRAIQYCRNYVKKWVDQAVAYRDSLATEEKMEDPSAPYIFINELAKEQGVDANRIHNETLNVLLAGRDTTASLLSHLWYVLARRKDVWDKLRGEVQALDEALPTYVKLKEMRYMRNCIRETLRLYAPLPIVGKRAAKDTVLPRGGGPHGDRPLFVPKGINITPSLWSLHRDCDVYGADADDFRPERWDDPSLRPHWSYIPFGGGPRVCLGQQYAQSQAAYVTTRLIQHFACIEARDQSTLRHKLAPTISVYGGTRIAMFGTA